ncbi:peptide chain release factor N(5)-glutamine methyltransferase [Nevskia soli]|uniref:peptide chain release factor N(5)-glutamine methyltransferase n=1 Tax=Nevskia soli TaxID=418856 RepID=UPI0004A75D20
MADWLGWAAGALSGGDSPRLDAELLLCELLGCNRTGLLIREDDTLTAETALRYAALIERRQLGEPVAYLIGRREFWSLDLQVSPAVLIPRPDTELLVEWALERLRGLSAPRIADLGTGSGAIALALASERPDAQVCAVDASADALAQAAHNARLLGLERVEFRLGDWFAPLAGECFDLIVSNPPYVAEQDPHLDALRFEPRRALTAGADGLADLRRISAGARGHLKPGAALLLEHGADQGEAVRALLHQHGYGAVETRRDLNGLERVTLGTCP